MVTLLPGGVKPPETGSSVYSSSAPGLDCLCEPRVFGSRHGAPQNAAVRERAAAEGGYEGGSAAADAAAAEATATGGRSGAVVDIDVSTPALSEQRMWEIGKEKVCTFVLKGLLCGQTCLTVSAGTLHDVLGVCTLPVLFLSSVVFGGIVGRYTYRCRMARVANEVVAAARHNAGVSTKGERVRNGPKEVLYSSFSSYPSPINAAASGLHLSSSSSSYSSIAASPPPFFSWPISSSYTSPTNTTAPCTASARQRSSQSSSSVASCIFVDFSDSPFFRSLFAFSKSSFFSPVVSVTSAAPRQRCQNPSMASKSYAVSWPSAGDSSPLASSLPSAPATPTATPETTTATTGASAAAATTGTPPCGKHFLASSSTADPTRSAATALIPSAAVPTSAATAVTVPAVAATKDGPAALMSFPEVTIFAPASRMSGARAPMSPAAAAASDAATVEPGATATDSAAAAFECGATAIEAAAAAACMFDVAAPLSRFVAATSNKWATVAAGSAPCPPSSSANPLLGRSLSAAGGCYIPRVAPLFFFNATARGVSLPRTAAATPSLVARQYPLSPVRSSLSVDALILLSQETATCRACAVASLAPPAFAATSVGEVSVFVSDSAPITAATAPSEISFSADSTSSRVAADSTAAWCASVPGARSSASTGAAGDQIDNNFSPPSAPYDARAVATENVSSSAAEHPKSPVVNTTLRAPAAASVAMKQTTAHAEAAIAAAKRKAALYAFVEKYQRQLLRIFREENPQLRMAGARLFLQDVKTSPSVQPRFQQEAVEGVAERHHPSCHYHQQPSRVYEIIRHQHSEHQQEQSQVCTPLQHQDAQGKQQQQEPQMLSASKKDEEVGERQQQQQQHLRIVPEIKESQKGNERQEQQLQMLSAFRECQKGYERRQQQQQLRLWLAYEKCNEAGGRQQQQQQLQTFSAPFGKCEMRVEGRPQSPRDNEEPSRTVLEPLPFVVTEEMQEKLHQPQQQSSHRHPTLSLSQSICDGNREDNTRSDSDKEGKSTVDDEEEWKESVSSASDVLSPAEIATVFLLPAAPLVSVFIAAWLYIKTACGLEDVSEESLFLFL